MMEEFNPLNAKLNPICHLLALLGAHLILHIRRIRANIQGKENFFLQVLSWNVWIHPCIYSAIRPVPHGEDLPMPEPPKEYNLNSEMEEEDT